MRPLRAASAALTAVVVDCASASRALVRDALRSHSFSMVGEGACGDEAVALFERHRPALAVVDLVLPRLDGAAAAERILARHPEATVLVTSAFASRERLLFCHRIGVAHVLLKPIDLERLARFLQRRFGELRAAEAA